MQWSGKCKCFHKICELLYRINQLLEEDCVNFQFINDRLRFAISIFTWRQCVELAINLLDDSKYNVSLILNSEGTQSVVSVDCLVFRVVSQGILG